MEPTARKILQLLLVAAFAAAASSDEVSVEVTLSEPPGGSRHFRPGDNATVVCRLSNGYIGILVHFYKVVTLGDGENKRELISTNYNLAPKYDKPRFKADIVNTGAVTLSLLHIYGVTREDAGNYECEVRGISRAVELSLYAAPQEIYFDGYSDGDTIEFLEDEAKPIICHVKDALPQPTMRVAVGSRDYTDTFDLSTEFHGRCIHNTDDCPLHYTYDYSLSNEQFQPHYESDGGLLICSAHFDGSREVPRQVTLNVLINYAPKVSCDPTQLAGLSQEYVVSCRVQSKPAPSIIRWEFTSGEKPYGLYVGSIPQDGFEAKLRDVDSYTKVVSLKVSEVQPEHFVLYNLVVENSMGETTATVRLEQDMSVTVVYASRDSAAVSSVSLLTLALAAVISLFVGH